MKYLFTTKGFYLKRELTFRVSRIDDNLYLADCADDVIKRFIIKKNAEGWVSDNEMTQFITLRIGTMIEKFEHDPMKKIHDFVRSNFSTPETKKPAEEETNGINPHLARL